MTEINFQTILADTRDNIGKHDEEKYRRSRELQNAAVQQFAALNNWTTSRRVFPPQAIISGKRRTNNTTEERGVFDHCTYYLVQRRNAAIVSEPYAPDCRERAAHFATELGLQLHVPPNPRASIWAPGDAFFLVFTAPGSVVQWLPEQMVPS